MRLWRCLRYPFPAGRLRRGGPRNALSVFSAYLFIVALLGPVPLTALGSAPAHTDTDTSLPDTPFITWNMQGSTVQGDSLWSNYLSGKLAHRSHEPAQGESVPTGGRLVQEMFYRRLSVCLSTVNRLLRG
jgi:hypothetical protein